MSSLPLALAGAGTGMKPASQKRLNCTATSLSEMGSSSASTALKRGVVSLFLPRRLSLSACGGVDKVACRRMR